MVNTVQCLEAISVISTARHISNVISSSEHCLFIAANSSVLPADYAITLTHSVKCFSNF